MELEKQICSLELAKRLKELGVEQGSIWAWREHTSKLDGVESGISSNICANEGRKSGNFDTYKDEYFAAFTVAEFGEMLQAGLVRGWKGINGKWYCVWAYSPEKLEDKHPTTFEATTEADARAKMLIYLIENGLYRLIGN
jgi:hypothetical protein